MARLRIAQAELQAATAAADQLKLPEKPPPEIWPPDAPLVGSTVAAESPEKPKVHPKLACRPLARAPWRCDIFLVCAFESVKLSHLIRDCGLLAGAA